MMASKKPDNDDDLETFGGRLYHARHCIRRKDALKPVSIDDLAAKIGVSRSWLRHLERDEFSRGASAELMDSIAAAYEQPREWLLYRNGKDPVLSGSKRQRFSPYAPRDEKRTSSGAASSSTRRAVTGLPNLKKAIAELSDQVSARAIEQVKAKAYADYESAQDLTVSDWSIAIVTEQHKIMKEIKDRD